MTEHERRARMWERKRDHWMGCARHAKSRVPLAVWDIHPQDWQGQITQYVADARQANRLARTARNRGFSGGAE